MKKNRRIISIMLALSMMLTGVAVGAPGVSDEVYAASNPYNYYAKDSSGNWANCTWWAWQLAYDNCGVTLPGWGNAGTWYSSAQAAGYSCDQTPSANSIAVRNDTYYGHVQFVTSVSGSQIYVKEGGYRGTSNGYHEGWTSQSGVVGYIHLSNDNPIGNYDHLSSPSPGRIYVAGWGFDPNSLGTQIEIHVYIGADSSAAGGEGHVIKANGYRADVNATYGCGNYHGFSATINTNKTGSQPVYVYAINVGNGSNVCLGSKTVNIESPNPVGAFDVVQDQGGSIVVRGWAFDPEDKTKQLSIHVYVGGPSNETGEGHQITANTYRNDVNKTYSCGDYHGFNSTISTNRRGKQTVYVYAINIGLGDNVLLGKRDVTITDPKTIALTSSMVSSISAQTYTGNAVTPAVIVEYSGKTLTKGTDYTVSYKNNVDVGTAQAVITGIGKYTGTVTVNFQITKKTTAITKATLNNTSFTYNGSEQKPTVKTVNGKKTLKEGTDYEISYLDANKQPSENLRNAGTYYAAVTGIGNYSGTVYVKYTVAQGTGAVSPDKTSATVYSDKNGIVISSTAKDSAKISYSLDKTSKKYVTLQDNGDGTATVTGIKAGSTKVTVTAAATANCKSSSKIVKITVKDSVNVAGKKITTVGSAQWNGGEEINPAVTVKSGKTIFQAGTDYKLRYELVNTGEGTNGEWDVGDTVKVTVDATDKDTFACKGTITKSVVITKATQTATATAPSTIYYGEGKEPVQIDVDNIPSTDGDTNPTITYKSSNTKYAKVDSEGNITPIKKGKVTITVNIGATKHYTAKTIKFTVNVKAATKLTSKNVKITAAYNDGENVVPTVTVTGFKEDVDYTVDYDNFGINDIGHKITVIVTAVAEGGGCLGSYEKEVVVGKGEQSITIDSQPTTVKVKATTDTFTIMGVKDDATVSVSTKTYAKIKDIGKDQDGNNQYAITGVKKGTATVTVKLAATSKYNAKNLTFKVKVAK